MNVALSFDADLSDWLRAFGNVERKLADATPAHELIGDKLVDESRDNFITSGGPEKWLPLAPSTLKKTPRPGDKPLLVTHDLYDSMQKDVHKEYVDAGSPLVYARAQFEGTSRIPARSPFNWRQGFLQEVGAVYITFLFGAL